MFIQTKNVKSKKLTLELLKAHNMEVYQIELKSNVKFNNNLIKKSSFFCKAFGYNKRKNITKY